MPRSRSKEVSDALRSSSSSTNALWSPRFLILQCMLCGTCLCLGFLMGINYELSACASLSSSQNEAVHSPPVASSAECEAKFKTVNDQKEKYAARIEEQYRKLQRLYNGTNTNIGGTGEPRFPVDVDDLLEGMAFVDRDEFNERFESGVPLDPTAKMNNKVLVLYSDATALPKDVQANKAARENGDIPTLNVFRAMHNCDYLNVILLQTKRQRQCTAIVGQYASYHVQKWMRLPNKDANAYGPLDSKAPLQMVNRGAQPTGRKSTRVPKIKDTQRYWQTLKTYLDTLPSVLEQLRPIAAKVAKQNTVVVMVCNHGQSELLINFVCSAKSRNLDLSSVLVFATDVETKELAEGMGLTAFYDATNYGTAPSKAAQRYGDAIFTTMMLAKIYCVQMVSMLGYDVLFQDVDIVWYRNPLDYFHDEKSPSHGFDIYFQDDGNRAVYYAPYSSNSGFYFVRANEVTQYFFNSLLMSGDMIFTSNSHQIAVVAILSEFASRYGMKVKVLSKDTDEFPCGHAFHDPNRKQFMKDIFKGVVHPYIFHMSWTANKDNKLLFFRQMGEWYVNDKCIGGTMQSIAGQDVPTNTEGPLVGPCCSATAIFSCHYQDKPSREPCPNAPFIDPHKQVPFW